MALKYRLGYPVFTTAGKCPTCPKFSDVYEDHAISCGTEGERIGRHNHPRDTLYHTCASAALAPTKEGRALLPWSNTRPADVFLPHWSSGEDTAWDVSVVNPL